MSAVARLDSDDWIVSFPIRTATLRRPANGSPSRFERFVDALDHHGQLETLIGIDSGFIYFGGL